MYFKLSEYRFTLGEVMDEDSDGSVTTLRNWIAREIINIGQKHKLGRWQFNIYDIIRVRTNFSLTGLGIAPVDANALADFVVARAHMLFSLDEEGQLNLLRILKAGSTLGQQTLFVSTYEKKVAYVDETGSSVWWKNLRDGSLVYMDEISWKDNSHLVVPIDQIVAAAVMKYFKMASEEEGEPFENAESIDGMLLWFSKMTEDEKRRTMPKFSVAYMLEASISVNAIEGVMIATAQYKPSSAAHTAFEALRDPANLDAAAMEIIMSAMKGHRDDKE